MVEPPGFEADDVIATLATQAEAEGDDVIIVTGDRDSYQLVGTPTSGCSTTSVACRDYALYDEAGILERTGVRPEQYVFYAALRGDPSDNLPGVPGVGEKTAAKLINKYGDLDGIFANVADQTPKLRENLDEHEQQARTNVEMMTLVRDVPLDITPEELVQGEFDTDEVLELFNFLEFPSLVPRLPEAFPDRFGDGAAASLPAVEVLEAEVSVAADPDDAAAVLTGLADRDTVAVAGSWAGVPGRSALEGLAVVTNAGSGRGRLDPRRPAR